MTIDDLKQGSLPYRQLRKVRELIAGATSGSLPYRQLRKYLNPISAKLERSLPYRQLRKPRIDVAT